MRNFAKLMIAASLLLGYVAQANDFVALPQLTDPQIEHIVWTASKIDGRAAVMAQEKAQNQDLKGYAQTVAKDVTATITKGTELWAKTGIKPEDNDVSKKLLQSADQSLTKVSALGGNDFDKAYISFEVSFKEQLVKDLDQTLIPAAKNAQLIQFLKDFRFMQAGHLDAARKLQGQIHFD